MAEKSKMKKEIEALSKDIKKLFLIYDYIRTFSKNIDEFNTSKIILTRDIKQKTLIDLFNFYKNKIHQNEPKLNNKTCYFIDLMKKIFSYDFIPHHTDIQLLLIYNLVFIFHKETNQFDIEKFQKSLNIYLVSSVNNYSDYCEILKNIGLLKEDNEENKDIQFLNFCKIIQHLNKDEFNSSLSAFLLLNDSIPQYRNIIFPKLDSKEDEKTYNEKIRDIALLLEVINSSLGMRTENIRYEMFKKYMNQEDKLKAINKVLSSLNKKHLKNLNEYDLIQNVELHMEDNKFIKNENDKGIKTIEELEKEIKNCQISIEAINCNIEIINGEIKIFSQNIKETEKNLKEEKLKKLNYISKLESKEKEMKKLYDELKNIKYRCILRYIIDYFICLLNNNEYKIVKESNYGNAINYIVEEMKNDKYEKYKNTLLKKGIIINDLLEILLETKFDSNILEQETIIKENEFIKLIEEKNGKEIGNKFEILFKETPLLRQFCFAKGNGITRNQIKNAILTL